MALRWAAAGLLEAKKTFRRLKAYRQLPILRRALQEHMRRQQAESAIETILKTSIIDLGRSILQLLGDCARAAASAAA